MIIRKLLNYWFSKKRDSFYLFFLILFMGMYAAGYGMNLYDLPSMAWKWKTAGFLGFLLTVTFLLIHMNLYAGHEFLRIFENQAHIPKKQIQHVNSFCITVFLCATLMAMIGLSFLLEPLWPAIAAWFLSLSASAPPPKQPETFQSASAPGPDFAALLGEAAPPPEWMKIVDRILNLAGYLLILLLCLVLLRTLLVHVWRWITKPRHFDDDEKIYLKPTLFLNSQNKPIQKGRGLSYYLSYSGKIRRFYRNKILSSSRRTRKKSPLPAWASPEELEKASGIKDQTLHQIYEKTRYGQQGGSESDWKTLTGRH